MKMKLFCCLGARVKDDGLRLQQQKALSLEPVIAQSDNGHVASKIAVQPVADPTADMAQLAGFLKQLNAVHGSWLDRMQQSMQLLHGMLGAELVSIAALSPSRQAYVTLAAEGDLAGSLDVGQVQGLVGGSGPAAPCSAVASAARHSSTRSSPNTWLHPISSHGSLASESLQTVFRMETSVTATSAPPPALGVYSPGAHASPRSPMISPVGSPTSPSMPPDWARLHAAAPDTLHSFIAHPIFKGSTLVGALTVVYGPSTAAQDDPGSGHDLLGTAATSGATRQHSRVMQNPQHAAKLSKHQLPVVAAFLGSLFQPPEVAMCLDCLVELSSLKDMDALVRSLSRAVVSYLKAQVHLAPHCRIALMRGDGTAAAVFEETAGGGPGGPSSRNTSIASYAGSDDFSPFRSVGARDVAGEMLRHKRSTRFSTPGAPPPAAGPPSIATAGANGVGGPGTAGVGAAGAGVAQQWLQPPSPAGAMPPSPLDRFERTSPLGPSPLQRSSLSGTPAPTAAGGPGLLPDPERISAKSRAASPAGALAGAAMAAAATAAAVAAAKANSKSGSQVATPAHNALARAEGRNQRRYSVGSTRTTGQGGTVGQEGFAGPGAQQSTTLQGHVLLLTHTLLGQAVDRQAGVWVSDCTLYLHNQLGQYTASRDVHLGKTNKNVASIAVTTACAPQHRVSSNGHGHGTVSRGATAGTEATQLSHPGTHASATSVPAGPTTDSQIQIDSVVAATAVGTAMGAGAGNSPATAAGTSPQVVGTSPHAAGGGGAGGAGGAGAAQPPPAQQRPPSRAPSQNLWRPQGEQGQGQPLLGVYIIFSTVLPSQLLRSIISHTDTLVEALVPLVHAKLTQDMAEEWTYLHDHVLDPRLLQQQQQRHGGGEHATELELVITPNTSGGGLPPHLASREQPLQQAGVAPTPRRPLAEQMGPGTEAVPTAAAATVAASPGGPGQPHGGAGIHPLAAEVLAQSLAIGQEGGMGAVGTAAAAGGVGPLAQVLQPNKSTGTGIAAVTGGPPVGSSLSQATVATLAQQRSFVLSQDGQEAGAAAKPPSTIPQEAGGLTTPPRSPVQANRPLGLPPKPLPPGSSTSPEKLGPGRTQGFGSTAAAATGVTAGGAGAGAAAAGPEQGPVAAGLAGSRARRRSFVLCDAPTQLSPNRKLAPMLAGLHDKLRSIQARLLHDNTQERLEDLQGLELLEKIGAGGYGSVFRGLYNGVEVAVKVTVPAAHEESEEQAVRDAFELAVMTSVSHPSLVCVHCFFNGVCLVRTTHDPFMSPESSVAGSRPPSTEGPQYQAQGQAYQAQQYAYNGQGQRQGMGAGTGAAAAAGAARGRPLVGPKEAAGDGVDTTGDAWPCGAAADKRKDAAGSSRTMTVMTPQNPGPGLGVLRLVPAYMLPEDQQAGLKSHLAIVMELCDGGSLLEAIREGAFQERIRGGFGASSPRYPFIYTTLLEVAMALRHLHALQLAHCDLKPSNILLKTNARDMRGFSTKLSDFGLVKLMVEDESGRLVIGRDQNTGTVTHMAPELFGTDAAGGAAVDVFSFGILMWEMVSGGCPVYCGMQAAAIREGVRHKGLRPEFTAGVAPEYVALAQACWAQDPSTRPTASELVCAVRKLLVSSGSLARTKARRFSTSVTGGGGFYGADSGTAGGGMGGAGAMGGMGMGAQRGFGPWGAPPAPMVQASPWLGASGSTGAGAGAGAAAAGGAGGAGPSMEACNTNGISENTLAAIRKMAGFGAPPSPLASPHLGHLHGPGGSRRSRSMSMDEFSFPLHIL